MVGFAAIEPVGGEHVVVVGRTSDFRGVGDVFGADHRHGQAGIDELLHEVAGIDADIEQKDRVRIGRLQPRDGRGIIGGADCRHLGARELEAGVGERLVEIADDDLVGRALVDINQRHPFDLRVGRLPVFQRADEIVVRLDRAHAPEIWLALAEIAGAAAAIERQHLVLSDAGKHRADVADVGGEHRRNAVDAELASGAGAGLRVGRSCDP